MKVLYLCSWYRDMPEEVGGVFFGEQASAMAERGYDVAIACFKPRSFRYVTVVRPFRVSEQEWYAGDTYANVYRGETLVLPPRFRRLNKLLRRWQLSRFLKLVFSDFGRPDIVHIQSAVVVGVHGADAILEHKIPYVITEHATSYRRGRVPEQNIPAIRQCFEHASAAFAVSTTLIDDLKRIGVSNRIDVLPNMYDSNLFNLENIDRSDDFTFLMVCQLTAKKGVDIALEAFAKVHSEYEGCRFLLAGDGPGREQIAQQIDALGIRGVAQLLGSQSRENVALLMKKSHCIVSASHFETFGVTLIEGLACGMTVVATRSGGPEDFVVPPFGSLVPTNDATALAGEMSRMLRTCDKSKEALQERNKYVNERFSKEEFGRRVSAIYEKVVRTL